MATVDADGIPTIIAPTGPFGERTPQHIAPQNTANGVSNGYLGVHRKASETDYLIQPMQMGARVYIPELGRFLQVDPVEGGTLNNYVYAQDPVNQRDLDGKFLPFLAIAALVVRAIPVIVAVVKVVPKVATKVVQAAKTVYTAVKNVVTSIPKSVPRTTTTATKPSAAPTPVQMQQVNQQVGNRSAPLLDRSLQNTLGNKPTTINGINYTGHAQNAMQNAGIYPSMVQSTIRTGRATFGRDGAMIYDDAYNQLRVIVNPNGSIKTTYWFGG